MIIKYIPNNVFKTLGLVYQLSNNRSFFKNKDMVIDQRVEKFKSTIKKDNVMKIYESQPDQELIKQL